MRMKTEPDRRKLLHALIQVLLDPICGAHNLYLFLIGMNLNWTILHNECNHVPSAS